jgi:copper chaperone CopZ
MRHFLAAAVATVALAGLAIGQARAEKVEIKGAHICCGNCVKAAKEVLGKVDGVSDAAADAKEKTVTFTAKDDKAAAAGIKALVDSGIFGTATKDGKEYKIEVPEVKKGSKADSVTVKDVHACCGMCKKAIGEVLKDLKVTYEGDGAAKTIKIEGKDLDKADILASLRKAGFNGTVDK